jgi:endonuclease YncB( thermonuclease family)
LVFGKEVVLQRHGYDKYQRTIADVLLSDGANVNHTLVKDGWCSPDPFAFPLMLDKSEGLMRFRMRVHGERKQRRISLRTILD